MWGWKCKGACGCDITQLLQQHTVQAYNRQLTNAAYMYDKLYSEHGNEMQTICANSMPQERQQVPTFEGDALLGVISSGDSVQSDPLSKAPVAAPRQIIPLGLTTGCLLLHSTFPALQPAEVI